MSDVSSDLMNASKISKFDIGKISLRILKQSKIGVMKKCFICNVSDYPKKKTKCPNTANICGAIPPEVVVVWSVAFMKREADSINVIRN